MSKHKQEFVKIKGKIGNQEIVYELPKNAFDTFIRHEKPHIHRSNPHPSKNDKICDLCQKQMVKHYHVCEECFKFLKESHTKTIRDLQKRIKKLEAGK